MSIIYQPSGRAAEYADWACNLFKGCPHQCAYCFAPSVLRMSKYEFHQGARERKDLLKRLQSDAANLHNRERIHLCFTTDPYPLIRSYPPPDQRSITREAIQILKREGLGVQILTKGGMESTSDLDLLDGSDEYATTLTLDNDEESRLWEPHAALPNDRLEALYYAVSYGVTAWASLEPVIYPEQSLYMLERALETGISKVKVGPLNYKGRLPKWLRDQVPELEAADWRDFANEVRLQCRRWSVECILKNDLKALIA